MDDQREQLASSRVERAHGSPTPTQKKPYRTPRLTVYGDLRNITRQKGGSKSDGGQVPKTKM